MVKILRSVGGNFRLAGPLTVANYVRNPGFDLDFDPSTFGWTSPTWAIDTTTSQFGNSSAKVSIPSSSDTGTETNGISQMLVSANADMADTTTWSNPESCNPGQDYTLSLWVNVPVQLPGPLVSVVSFYDQNGSILLGQQQTQLTLGGVTAGWVSVSILINTCPDGAAIPAILIGCATTGPFSAYTFNVDGVRWTSGDESNYVDGSFSSYVWATDAYTSFTLLSSPPTVLASFKGDDNLIVARPVIL